MVPSADITTITMISQINDYNDMHNIYISSKNLHKIYLADGQGRVWHNVNILFIKTSKKKIKKKISQVSQKKVVTWKKSKAVD